MNSADFLVVHTRSRLKWMVNVKKGNLGYDFKSPYWSYERDEEPVKTEEPKTFHEACYGDYVNWITPKINECKIFIRGLR